jgi:hypothetical protein
MNETHADLPNDKADKHDDVARPAENPPESDPLADAEMQAAYRREYLRQLRQRGCPGCGEGDEVF